MNTLLALLLACSNAPDTVESNYDRRADWELFVPAEERAISMPSTIRWYADPTITSKVAPAAHDWELHLSCGVRFRQVERPSDADLTISCSDFPGAGERGTFLMNDQAGNVTITRKACEVGGLVTMRWSLAMGMGLKQHFEWYNNESDGSNATLELAGHADIDWSSIETDGWRAWALEKGAPGCGNDELEWTWIKDPNLYRNPPPADVAQRLISLSGATSD